MRISDWSSDVCSSDLRTTIGSRRYRLRIARSRAIRRAPEPSRSAICGSRTRTSHADRLGASSSPDVESVVATTSTRGFAVAQIERMPMTARGWSSAMNMRTGAFGVDSQDTVDAGGPSKTVIGAGAVQRTLLACGLREFLPFCALDARAHMEHPTYAATYEQTSRAPGSIHRGDVPCCCRPAAISESQE